MLPLNGAEQKNIINATEKYLKVPGFEDFPSQSSN